jgi:hypothetical protein
LQIALGIEDWPIGLKIGRLDWKLADWIEDWAIGLKIGRLD